MSKRRTRREKENVHHQFTIAWEPSVKGHFENKVEDQKSNIKNSKRAEILTKDDPFEATRRDILKSLILASLILSVELVIYLAKLS